MLVSFIIPAYNAADTIVRCLESIRNLTLEKEDYEIIVIDDASTDNTCEIVEQYAQQLANDGMSRDKSLNESHTLNDGNLILLRQPENHRQGAARNRGVKEAKGECICFVDADDAVTKGIVKAIRSAEDNSTDMTAYHYAFVNEQGIITKEADRLRFEEGLLFSGVEMQNKHPYWCAGPVAYIYNRGFLERVNYPFVEGVLFEDSDFVAVHLYYAKRMAYSQELGYKAYYREGSTTHHTSYKNVADYLLLGERMLRFYEFIVKSEEVRSKSEEVERFADGILEGACYNISRSCKRLMRLHGTDDVRAFYDRIDSNINRCELSIDNDIRKYYWTTWTSLCLKHKKIAMSLLACIIPMYRIVKR